MLTHGPLPLGRVAGPNESLVSPTYCLGPTKTKRVRSFDLTPGAENGVRTRDPRLGKPMLYH